jgi:hypothetical protein
MKGTKETPDQVFTSGFLCLGKHYACIEDIPRKTPKDSIIYACGISHDARITSYIKEKA